ncbi:mitochondrial import inner membrane translocase subunit Tim21-like [Sycon ciliatum]|uniref:mitochondrial import inner membrane translocase subunit Tim21-like n=1 Tax=Sycon ciliatum TaxID=27933 RepID=UPI0020AD3FF9|eukprot:scpid82083/ scgid7816/ Mitochondrial import inner membrane translocase subunit Tim21; TIM21-like protein, mitochondrial
MAGLLTQRLCSSLSRLQPCFVPNGALAERTSRRVLKSLPPAQCRYLAITAECRQKLDTSKPGAQRSEKSKGAIEQILESEASRKSQLTTAEKVVEAGKDAGYSMVAMFGLGMVCVAGGFLIYNEFSGSQPSVIFRRSLRIVRKDKQVQSLVGSPFKAFGFSNTISRGYRHQVYSVDYLLGAFEDLHRQVKYNIKGKHRQAVVTVDMKETKKGSGKFDYYSIVVEATGSPPIMILDNRYSDISLASYKDLDGPPSPST